MRQGWGKPQINRSIREQPFSIAGQKFERGVGTHAESSFGVTLDGKAARFLAEVGVDDEVKASGKGSAEFRVFGDGKELPQLALARVFRPGDFRSGYYRDQTFMMAVGRLSLDEYFDGKKPLVISYVYTSCPVVCPTITAELKKAVAEVAVQLAQSIARDAHVPSEVSDSR